MAENGRVGMKRKNEEAKIGENQESKPKAHSNKKVSMSKFVRNPDELLRNPDCKAVVLSVSDGHANILVWNDVVETDSSGNLSVVGENRSLFKITVVPGHKEQLPVKKRITDMVELDKTTKETKAQECKQIVSFLSNLRFNLTSESGAEYSYYTAVSEKSWWSYLLRGFGINAVGGGGAGVGSSCDMKVRLELISPASKNQIARALPSPSMALVEETPQVYQRVVEPFIQTIVRSGSLSWIENVIQIKKEIERVLFNCDDFIINIDTKWRSHPDANTVSRDEWFGHESVVDLYCLGIVKDGSIRSIRDLRQNHIPMLQSMVVEGQKVIEQVYGIKKDQIRIFVHYHPQFYHFHVHFTRLENEIGCEVERGHLVTDIIQNLTLDSDFYAKRTIYYKVKTSSELYFLINEKDKI